MDFLNYENADTLSIDTLALEESLKEERNREITGLHSLSKKVSNLHTSVLYYRNPKTKTGSVCYEVWKTLVKKVGGTPNGWRDLGISLGIKQEDLDYIMNSVQEEPVDVILKLYRLNEKATLDKIVDAFVKLKRYDILKALEDPLCNLSHCFNNKDDSGYHSNSKSTDGQIEIISLKNVSDDLPPVFNKNFVVAKNDRNKPHFPKPKIETTNEEFKNEKPILFLTFTEDGFPTALNIQEYVENWTDFDEVAVITLNDKKEEVYQNPEKFIREYFEKADFIVPIITPGYLQEIRSNNPNTPSTTDNLDFKYVNFIYSLIVNYYIHATGCLNKKVRTVLPQNFDREVLTRISMYPDLMPWTYETKFDEQFKAFLKLKYS
ncbi:uncharacterized protein LOC106129264 [Amyelois transitella]|uniref:uncharacterized protein LOC106129264 n=1 Tax=Amyelois transitella TaxID=680683 RepID=UPI00067D97BA|nr:uncharacterized protein LOC106129264 [Amyelois transitella]